MILNIIFLKRIYKKIDLNSFIFNGKLKLNKENYIYKKINNNYIKIYKYGNNGKEEIWKRKLKY